MVIKRHGHSFIEIETNNWSILIDPFIKGNTDCDVNIEQIIQRPIAAICLTHGHSDHLGDTPQIAKATGCTVICEFGLAHYLTKELGLEKVIPCSIGGTIRQSEFSVKFVTAIHGNGIQSNNNPYKNAPAGLIIKTEGKTIYHAGDTALTLDMQLIGMLEQVELACLPIGDTFTMGVEDAVVATTFIKPKQVMPIHYNTRPVIKADTHHFAQRINEKTSSKPLIPAPWEPITL